MDIVTKTEEFYLQNHSKTPEHLTLTNSDHGISIKPILILLWIMSADGKKQMLAKNIIINLT